MALLDHFHPPLSSVRHWQGFHSAWANELVRQLNDELLPERYFAEATVKLGVHVEVDVATFQASAAASESNGGLAVAVWAPPQAPFSVPIDFSGLDTFEVQVLNDEAGPSLVAAIELVSPGNKDRPETRHALAIKCASYLQQGISVVLVDVVTSRTGNLFEDLLGELRLSGVRARPTTGNLYAVACRAAGGVDECRLEAWPHALALGAELPTVPLWLARESALPVDLQRSYEATCAVLRIGAT